METNTCDINHLDADALLPPDKCLIAGIKKHVPEAHSPAPLTSCGADNDYNIRLNNILRAHMSNQNLSNKEIAEASQCAAIKASEIAKAKRAVAEQKAAKAMAAAKSALELVATIEDEAAKKDKCLKINKMKKYVHVQELLEIAEAKRAVAEQKAAKAVKAMAAAKSAVELVATIEDEAAKKDKRLKMNKMKKHVHVQELYDTDKEMALNLHRNINSSPRMLKSPMGHKCQEMKVDTEGYVKEIDKVVLGNGNGKMSRVSLEKDGFSEPLNGLGQKKGRIKQKKLLLSVCSFRDQTRPKDEVKSCVETSGNGLMPVETWKCQEVRAPACVSQNKATGQRTRGSKAKVPENESKEEIESVGKAGLGRTRNSKDKKSENLIIGLDDDEEKKIKNVAEVEAKQGRNVGTRGNRSTKNNKNLSNELNIDMNNDLEPSRVKIMERVSMGTRNSRKEEIIDEPLIDLSVIEGKGTRKATRGRKNLAMETSLDVKEKEESKLEEQKVCEEDRKISEIGVDERETFKRENATEFAIKEGEVEPGNGEVLVDLEKMTLGEWLEFLEVYLPKEIVDATDEIISDMRKEAERLHEFVLHKKKNAMDEKIS